MGEVFDEKGSDIPGPTEICRTAVHNSHDALLCWRVRRSASPVLALSAATLPANPQSLYLSASAERLP